MEQVGEEVCKYWRICSTEDEDSIQSKLRSLPKCDLSKCAVQEYRDVLDYSDLDPSQRLVNLSLDEPKRPKSPPVIDEDGFEMVKPKSKGKRKGGTDKGGGEAEKDTTGVTENTTIETGKTGEGAKNVTTVNENDINGDGEGDKNKTIVDGDTSRGGGVAGGVEQNASAVPGKGERQAGISKKAIVDNVTPKE